MTQLFLWVAEDEPQVKHGLGPLKAQNPRLPPGPGAAHGDQVQHPPLPIPGRARRCWLAGGLPLACFHMTLGGG